MSATADVAAYCLGKLGPGTIQNYLGYVRHSGLTVAILGLLHIGRPEIEGQKHGDLIYNSFPDDLLVSDGVFNNPEKPAVGA